MNSPLKTVLTVTILGTKCCRPWDGRRVKVSVATNKASLHQLRYSQQFTWWCRVYPVPISINNCIYVKYKVLRFMVFLLRHSWEQRELDLALQAPTTLSLLQTRTKTQSAKLCLHVSLNWNESLVSNSNYLSSWSADYCFFFFCINNVVNWHGSKRKVLP